MSGRAMKSRWFLVLIAAVAVGVFTATVPTFREFFDLGVYRGAVQHWLLTGQDLYAFRYQESVYGFTYPPFAALVLSPLALTSWPVAVTFSLIVNVFCVILLLRWFLPPELHRIRWLAALSFLAVLLFEPVRDTFSFGQVNLVLLVLVTAGLRHPRWAGAGIGLAAAIKLTPAVFIGYLLLTRQYRSAAIAVGTAAGATVLAALIAPQASRVFWTEALWDTGRVGKLEYVSNQSLRGVVARLDVSSVWWLVAVLIVVACWAWWLRGNGAADPAAAVALTGMVACLISPVTWVHHLVWLLPAFLLILQRELGHRRRLAGLAALYVVFCSSFVWLWWAHPLGWGAFLGSNLYVWATLVLAVALVTPSLRARAGQPRERSFG
ncbi:glycosyltransferase 87 family protein [Actinoplanes sp. CA-015351]|uniref:glycosyltransferase 87 family protein n=1 Tax=Actinoplanes sp. CA-015351 TaxID=3239897 RepID=UPI003D957645